MELRCKQARSCTASRPGRGASGVARVGGCVSGVDGEAEARPSVCRRATTFPWRSSPVEVGELATMEELACGGRRARDVEAGARGAWRARACGGRPSRCRRARSWRWRDAPQGPPPLGLRQRHKPATQEAPSIGPAGGCGWWRRRRSSATGVGRAAESGVGVRRKQAREAGSSIPIPIDLGGWGYFAGPICKSRPSHVSRWRRRGRVLRCNFGRGGVKSRMFTNYG